MAAIKTTIPIDGMQCVSCESRVAAILENLVGVTSVHASYVSGKVSFVYDDEVQNIAAIRQAIREDGYSPGSSGIVRYAGLAFIAAIILLLSNFHPLQMVKGLLSQQVTYGIIFVIGLITGIHCIGMCGGLMISSLPTSKPNEEKSFFGMAIPTILYNVGRIVSYTIIGGIIGALGSALAISPQVKLWIIVLSGLLMVIMGLNMAGFNLLRGVFLRLPTGWTAKISSNGPMSLGLVTGLFPCGPLQIMQMYALGTGNAMAGAAAMLVFALGTTPAMLPVGIFSGMLTRNSSRTLLQLNGLLVIVLGLLMTNRGLGRLGISLFF